MIEIYIYRLRPTRQIFIIMDYLILMLEKYLLFRKRQNHLARKFFPTICVLRKYFSDYVYLKGMYESLKEIEIIQVVSKLTNLRTV